jgi:Ricin-type beta-trefoil lectin domain
MNRMTFMPFLRQAAATAAALLSVFALTGASPAKAATSSFEMWDGGTYGTADNRCATPSGGGTANGTIVTAWTCNVYNTSQWWHFVTTSYGKFIVNDNSSKCLTPSGGGTAAGTVLTLWTCDPNKAEISQKWGLDGGGSVENLHSGQAMGSWSGYEPPSPGEYLVLADYGDWEPYYG